MKQILVIFLLGALVCSCTLMHPNATEQTVDSTEVVLADTVADSTVIDTINFE